MELDPTVAAPGDCAAARAGPSQNAAGATLTEELDRFCDQLGARNYSPYTIEQRLAVVGAFIAWARGLGVRRPQDVNPSVLTQYQLHLFHHRKGNGEPLASRTQLVRLVAIRAFFKWLAREGRVSVDPAAELELPRGERRLPAATLSSAEAEAVLALPDPATPLGLRDRAILETLYSTGIRRLELTRLRVGDVDLTRRLILIRKGKGAKDRIVPTGERAAMWIAAYGGHARPDLACGRDEEALFVNARGAPLKPKKLSARVSAYVSAARLNKKGSCHLFRHTAATLMLENGADIRFIQAMLGHESLETTQIYTHVSIAQLAAVHAATHPGARLQSQGAPTAPLGEFGNECSHYTAWTAAARGKQ